MKLRGTIIHGLNESIIKKDLKASLERDKQILNKNGNAYSAGRHLYHQIKRTDKSPIIATSFNEAIEFKFGKEAQGGMIIFSTDVNVTDGNFINKIKNKLNTFLNRFFADKKLDRVSEKYSPQGWTVGKFLRGRYRTRNGKLFDENSLSIEVIGLDSNELISMTKDVCAEFGQETVLVKDYTSKDVMLVNSDKEIKENKQGNVYDVDFVVEWDCDDEECDLDSEFTAKVDFENVNVDNDEEVQEFLSEWLSDEYGFTHKGFTFHFSEAWKKAKQIFMILKKKGFICHLWSNGNLVEFRGSVNNDKGEKCESKGTIEVMKDGIITYSVGVTVNGKEIDEEHGSFGNYNSLEDVVMSIIAPTYVDAM